MIIANLHGLINTNNLPQTQVNCHNVPYQIIIPFRNSEGNLLLVELVYITALVLNLEKYINEIQLSITNVSNLLNFLSAKKIDDVYLFSRLALEHIKRFIINMFYRT